MTQIPRQQYKDRYITEQNENKLGQ